jgi:hypothetical protein
LTKSAALEYYKLSQGSPACLPITTRTQVSVFLCAYEQGKTNGYIPAELPTFLMNNPQPQAITSFAISLLLVRAACQSACCCL